MADKDRKKKSNKKAKFYSNLVFDKNTMKDFLPKETVTKLMKVIDNGWGLEIDLADQIAIAMKNWAISQGATHFTHWFQPLNGTTSEKHDSFLVPSGDNGKAIFKFSGKDLISGEGDASSFPNGGLRATFEARGYTAWDPSSNAFIKDDVLCIPTAFCSYNGQALDKKTPLLRSMDCVKSQVAKFMKIFNFEAKKTVVNVGAEQEFFLIPKSDFEAREDLIMCGRTLFGNDPVKGQELEEHYYGCIRPTVSNFLKELNIELWSLGIASHTKHNEAAPSQHELAPIFTNANRAIDENLITMEKMQLLASNHGLACLLHERPFEGINGSGKHCNWSIMSNGINLLDPGKTYEENIRFMAFLACVIAGVDEYQDLLRLSAASAGNDCRLGGNEAPPAIVSIYLGDQLQELVDSVIEGQLKEYFEGNKMDLGVSVLPKIMRDASDRNRTSPFAFTANKFEFRMPGSQANLSSSVMILNTAVSKSIADFVFEVNSEFVKHPTGMDDNTKNSIILNAIANVLKEHKRIIFNGDGYSEEWTKEAAVRGLSNYKTTADALPSLVDEKSIELFERFHVLSKEEIHSRYIISLENYNNLINIEANVMQRMAERIYIPAISAYVAEVADQINKINACGLNLNINCQTKLLIKLQNGLKRVYECLEKMTDIHNQVLSLENNQSKADKNAHELIPAMKKLRFSVDEMEYITSRDFWPVPSYNNMLFYV